MEETLNKILSELQNLNINQQELMIVQKELINRIENLEKNKDLLSLGQNEIKELIKQTTVYMAGKMSFSDRINMEINLLTETQRQQVLNRINAKTFFRQNHTWTENWDDDY